MRYYCQPRNALALIWTILVSTLLFQWFGEHGFDDPYITYRYAANIASGQGFVYNPGERVLSTTAPLYALMLACGAWFHIPIPLLSNALGCIGLAIGGLIFWRLGQVWKTPTVGTTGLLLYPTFPLLIVTIGAETIIVLTLIMAAFLACATRAYYLAAVLFALATLTRADSLVAVAVAGVFLVIVHARERRSLPWYAVGVYVLVLAPWGIFAWNYFGSPIPVTLAAKQQQGLMEIGRSFFEGLWHQSLYYWYTPSYRLHILLAGLGFFGLALYETRWGLLIGWSMVYATAYTLLGVTGYFWYYAPLVIGVLTLIGLGMAYIRQTVRRMLRHRWAVFGVQWGMLAWLLAAQMMTLHAIHQRPDRRLAIYQAVGEWLHESTPPHTSVATLEAGIIGYYSQRRIIDFAGLIQPETALRLTPTTTYTDAAIWAAQTFHPDYMVTHGNNLVAHLQHAADSSVVCQEVQRFHSPDFVNPLIVYHCHW